MRIVIRADTSDGVGTGHLVRCLALARKLRERSARVTVACAPVPAYVSKMVSAAGCELVDVTTEFATAKRRKAEEVLATVEQHADAAAVRDAISHASFEWAIVDHYGLDARWEHEMRASAGRILVIDDLTSRPHSCDLLVDQNPGVDREARHHALSGSASRCLIGPRYALLRSGFATARARIAPRQGRVERILVMYGGADPTGETIRAIKALQGLPSVATHIDVVVGSANPQSNALQALCSGDVRMRFHFDAANVAELMALADLALGACGTSAWERCCMYLPTIAVIAAENQREIAAGLAEAGVAEISGWHADLTVDHLMHIIERLAASPERVRAMSMCAGKLADGHGVDRVHEAMEEVNAHSRVLY